MKEICIIAPMLSSFEKIDGFLKNVKDICRDKYNFLLIISHIDDVPKKYVKKENIKFLKAEYSDNFDSCVTKGFEVADGDANIVVDVEDENCEKNIAEALIKFENGAEIVLMKRKKGSKNIFSRFARFIYSKMLQFAKLGADNFAYANFGLFTKRVSNVIKSFPEKNYYLRNFDCYEDYKIEFLEYQKVKKVKNFDNFFNQYSIMFLASFAIAIASLFLLIFGINAVKVNNQAFFTMIGITLIFAGVLFGAYNFHIWFLTRKTKLPL